MTKIAFLMDPIETVAIKKDSTLAMIRASRLEAWMFTIVGRKIL